MYPHQPHFIALRQRPRSTATHRTSGLPSSCPRRLLPFCPSHGPKLRTHKQSDVCHQYVVHINVPASAASAAHSVGRLFHVAHVSKPLLTTAGDWRPIACGVQQPRPFISRTAHNVHTPNSKPHQYRLVPCLKILALQTHPTNRVAASCIVAVVTCLEGPAEAPNLRYALPSRPTLYWDARPRKRAALGVFVHRDPPATIKAMHQTMHHLRYDPHVPHYSQSTVMVCSLPRPSFFPPSQLVQYWCAYQHYTAVHTKSIGGQTLCTAPSFIGAHRQHPCVQPGLAADPG